MIGCGLALNDTGFILVQATCPTMFESVGDFILEPRCLKFDVGLQTRGSKMGVQEVRSDSRPKGRERQELLRALSI